MHDPAGQHEIWRLLEEIHEGTLSDADAQLFRHRLHSDPEFRRRYLRLAALYGHLRMEGALLDGGMEWPEGLILPATHSVSSSPHRMWSRGTAVSVAAMLLIALLLLRPSIHSPEVGEPIAHSGQMSGPGEVDIGQGGGQDTPPPTAPAARFSRSVNVAWTPEGHRWSVGDVLNEGDILELADGRVELEFDSGAVMTLVGPAALEVQSPYVALLNSGTATTRVENVETGTFRVITPVTEVLDLGTEFGVRIGPDGKETDVVVFEGIVDLASRQREGRGPLRRLSVGEAVRVNEAGAWERVVSVDSDAFPFGDRMFDLPPRRPPVIVGVRDDLRSSDSAKFYRIHRGGLAEDARAYVDRVHEWNGVTEEGMPRFLDGADYIATFNDDKDDSPSITVELSGPAMLYVFYDDRMTVPDWLSSSFENTRYKVGLDEGPSRNHQFEVGPGPGVSIDTVHSVWRRRVDRSGDVVLGPVGPRVTGRTMYGIAAQPL